MDQCIFCKIVKGEMSSEKVYENDSILAFLDISPVNFGHTLVIPKKHYVNIYETPEEVISEIIVIAKKIAIALKNNIMADGVNICMNNDHAAGQVVMHSHVHVIPRIKNDGFQMWQSKKNYQEGEEVNIRNKITESLK